MIFEPGSLTPGSFEPGSLTHGSFPGSVPVEEIGDYCGDGPADRPCEPDTDRSEQPGEEDGQQDPEDQVGKGSGHEFAHHTGTAKDAVGDQLK